MSISAVCQSTREDRSGAKPVGAAWRQMDPARAVIGCLLPRINLEATAGRLAMRATQPIREAGNGGPIKNGSFNAALMSCIN